MAKKQAEPPVVPFRQHEPLQDYFTDGRGGWWSVARLLDDSKHLAIFDCPVAALDLSGVIWQGANMLELASHVKRVLDADMDRPILLDWEGSIADGRHRVLKALAEGRRTIKARRMTWRPEPCRREDPT